MGLAMALGVAALCLCALRDRGGLARPLAILAAAYALHVAQIVLSVLGQYQRLDPLLSAWALPGAALAGIAAGLGWQAWRVARALA